MKYYSIRIQNKKDGTEVRNITPYESRDDAEIQFHKCLATDMSTADMAEVLCMVINSTGGVEMSRNWNTTVEEPTVEASTVDAE